MEVIEFSPSSSNGERTPTQKLLAPLENDSEGEDDPMISGIIILVTARVEIMVASSSQMVAFEWPYETQGAPDA